MLNHEQVDAFARDGYLKIANVLTSDEIQALSDALDRVIAKGPDGFAPQEPKPVLFRNLTGDPAQTVWQIVNIWEAAPEFRWLVHHPAIVEAISRTTGFNDLQVWHDQVQYKPANYGGATGWHQDAPLWPSISPMTPVSAWIPFDDAEIENGCMWMVPGSHRWGEQMQFLGTKGGLKNMPEFTSVTEGFTWPPEVESCKLEVEARPVRRGEVHFHHSLTWHGSPMNMSTRPRRALAIHYMTSEAVFTGRPHPMADFIHLPVGGRMLDAGEHFPIVCRDGVAVPPPAWATLHANV
ncbi:MAG: phytanoyl-CoA dioxygenase family protein [Phycisphaeraceae bacterium]|nr:phytanoyl-CoA dioxygenase family protein [Phycisphaeraceae bacterium]